MILSSPSPDLGELKEILADIKRDDRRASEVIRRMRSFLTKAPFEAKNIDINDTMREVFDFLSVQASARNIALYLKPSPSPVWVTGDPVQLQQVIMAKAFAEITAGGEADGLGHHEWLGLLLDREASCLPSLQILERHRLQAP